MSNFLANETLFKKASEYDLFTFDFSAGMATSETITSIDSVTQETVCGGVGDLTIDTPYVTGTQSISVWINDGSNNRYKVEALVTTSLGRKLSSEGILVVKD